MIPTPLSSSSVPTIAIENVLSSDQPLSKILNVPTTQEKGVSVTADAVTTTEPDLISQFTDLAHTSFATSLIQPSSPQLTSSQLKLNKLFETEKENIEKLTEEHWKYPEYPLARIKKIMRMDEDVKMISGEVPVLFSKAIELFVTELTLRAWIYTEETKRRTIQRSDIAMAIAKNDMFDFLIDIVPREEIHSRTKTTKESTSTENTATSSDLLQAYIQLLSQQSDSCQENIECDKSDDEVITNDSTIANLAATSNLMHQQMQLLQQLAQFQQQQNTQDQQQSISEPVNKSSSSTDTVSTSHSHYSGLEVPNCSTQELPSSDSNILGLSSSNVQFHFQPQEHSATDIVTLLSSSQVDQLPTVTTQQLSLLDTPSSASPHLSDLAQLNGDGVERVVIHPRGMTQSYETSQLPTVDNGNRQQTLYNTTDEYSSDHF